MNHEDSFYDQVNLAIHGWHQAGYSYARTRNGLEITKSQRTVTLNIRYNGDVPVMTIDGTNITPTLPVDKIKHVGACVDEALAILSQKFFV